MIHLYIKTHNVTGLKYFGKTISKDPYKYKGSGTYWKRHLKVNGNDVNTFILGSFEDEDECKKVAIEFGKLNNIVDSKDWANLKEETLDGGFDHINKLSKEVRGSYYTKWYEALSEEEKLSHNKKKANLGSSNGMYGKDRSGDKAPMFGKTQSEEVKNTISEANSSKTPMVDAITGESVGSNSITHPNYISGKWVSINKGRKASDETKKALSEARKRLGTKPPSPKGKLWWNNGLDVIRSTDCPGEGFVRGRKPK